MYTIMFTSRMTGVVVEEEHKMEVADSLMESNRQFATAAQAAEYARTFNIKEVELFISPDKPAIVGTPYAERDYSSYCYRSGHVLVFHNLVERALFENEICGQISDGMWENTQPLNHWEAWAEAKVLVDPTGKLVGRNFYARKDNYRLSALIEYVGDRMKFYAELTMQFPSEVQECLNHDARLPDSLEDYDREVAWATTSKGSADKVATWTLCGLTREKVERTGKDMIITEKDLRGYLRGISECMKTYAR